MQKMGWFGVVRGHSRSTAMSPFDRAHTTFYSTLIETMCLSRIVFTARCYASAILAMGLCLSVSICLSVISRCSTKTAKHRITQTPHDSPVTLVFGCQRSPQIRPGSPPTMAPNAGGVVKIIDVRQITGYISKTVQDRRMVSIKVE